MNALILKVAKHAGKVVTEVARKENTLHGGCDSRKRANELSCITWN